MNYLIAALMITFGAPLMRYGWRGTNYDSRHATLAWYVGMFLTFGAIALAIITYINRG